MTFLVTFIVRQLLKLDKKRHPWVRRLAIITAVLGWISRRFGSRTQVVSLRKGETLQVSVVPKKVRQS